ncbi:MAG TPA: MBL fold metallo-hydrolase [Candidatus Agrococcus pullicola]|uniref:MBL fold metallo-hydrolase n=1 Tax=Candidatus Agrococcus pullicola TaxID=2838429 RepID=A0A9D1YWS5_9MICO|nr:MBL fold metallo-hydrolase [Candidatus Agrococcus pullicola]
MEIAPGLHRVGDDVIACYLLVADGRATLVDAGLPGHIRPLRRLLKKLDLTERDIAGLILTHGDVDHIGFAERLRSEFGTPVFVHPGDAARTRGDEKPPKSAGPEWRLGSALRFLGVGMRFGGRTRHPKVVRSVHDAEVANLPGNPQIIDLPGHSAGSVAVHFPSAHAVCVGDALTTKHVLTGKRLPQPAPFTDEPALADASLDALSELDATIVLPGHGPPWRGSTASLIDAVRAFGSSR